MIRFSNFSSSLKRLTISSTLPPYTGPLKTDSFLTHMTLPRATAFLFSKRLSKTFQHRRFSQMKASKCWSLISTGMTMLVELLSVKFSPDQSKKVTTSSVFLKTEQKCALRLVRFLNTLTSVSKRFPMGSREISWGSQDLKMPISAKPSPRKRKPRPFLQLTLTLLRFKCSSLLTMVRSPAEMVNTCSRV